MEERNSNNKKGKEVRTTQKRQKDKKEGVEDG